MYRCCSRFLRVVSAFSRAHFPTLIVFSVSEVIVRWLFQVLFEAFLEASVILAHRSLSPETLYSSENQTPRTKPAKRHSAMRKVI